MAPEFIPVESPQQIAVTAELAKRIWEQHYTSIIGGEQVRYMVESLQSPSAIAAAIRDGGARYFLIGVRGEPPVGYLCYERRGDTLFLSKIYLEDSQRGTGLGRRAFGFVCDRGRVLGCAKIELTVNRGNAIAIEAYRRWGMRHTGDKVADIGGGFVMDDHVFVYDLDSTS